MIFENEEITRRSITGERNFSDRHPDKSRDKGDQTEVEKIKEIAREVTGNRDPYKPSGKPLSYEPYAPGAPTTPRGKKPIV